MILISTLITRFLVTKSKQTIKSENHKFLSEQKYLMIFASKSYLRNTNLRSNSNMTPRLSGLYLAWFSLCSSLVCMRIERQWSREKFAILSLKPRSRVRILIYRTWAIIFSKIEIN